MNKPTTVSEFTEWMNSRWTPYLPRPTTEFIWSEGNYPWPFVWNEPMEGCENADVLLLGNAWRFFSMIVPGGTIFWREEPWIMRSRDMDTCMAWAKLRFRCSISLPDEDKNVIYGKPR